MNVYVVRHGQSEANLAKDFAGWSPTPLSALGRQQAADAGKLIAHIKFDKVYSSDLPRSVQTCNIALPDYEPELSWKLREVSVGNVMGRPNAEVRAEIGEETYLDYFTRQDFSAFGGETPADIQKRMFEFFKETIEPLEAEGCQNVIMFGHEGTMHRMLNYALGFDVPINNLRIQNAAIAKFICKNGKWKLAAWNYTGTL